MSQKILSALYGLTAAFVASLNGFQGWPGFWRRWRFWPIRRRWLPSQRAKAGKTVDYPLSVLGKLVRRKGRLMLDVHGETTAEAIAKAVREERDSRA